MQEPLANAKGETALKRGRRGVKAAKAMLLKAPSNPHRLQTPPLAPLQAPAGPTLTVNVSTSSRCSCQVPRIPRPCFGSGGPSSAVAIRKRSSTSNRSLPLVLLKLRSEWCRYRTTRQPWMHKSQHLIRHLLWLMRLLAFERRLRHH